MTAPIGLLKPTTRLGDKRSIEGDEAHLYLAHEAALKSMVLLKNDNGILPIDAAKVKTIAVLGAKVPYEQRKYASKPSGTIDFSTDITVGDCGSSRVNPDPEKSIGPFKGLEMAAGKVVRVVSGNSVKAAEKADFVVVVAGLTPGDEGEEYTGAGDRQSFALDAKINGTPQTDLIEAAIGLGKPMAVVLVGGSVIDMPWLDRVPAVVMSWYSGIHGGRALGDLLLGKSNFSGKLPLSWPNRYNELPVFDPGAPNPVPMGYYVGYRYYDRKALLPRFPFGYGKSYTEYTYSNLQVPCATATRHSVAQITVDVANTGKVSGEEVVFLFVGYPEAKTRMPHKELKGFARVALAPGEVKRVTLPLRIAELKHWNSKENRWDTPNGPIEVMVGGSAAALLLKDRIIIK